MGVVSGIVMPFQFGTNWSRFSDATANVISPLLAYEGLTAFFLEAAFLGVLLFGRKLVPRWAHFVAALMVAFGTLFSSFWILAANSWMQTPAGYKHRRRALLPDRLDRRSSSIRPFPTASPTPSSAFYITTGFVVLGVGAYLLRRGQFAAEGRTDAVDDAVAADRAGAAADRSSATMHGLNTLRAPAGQAGRDRGALGHRAPRAADPVRHSRRARPRRNRFAIEIPLLGSLILTHDLERRGARA